ncbi:MAG: hypothetical protein SF187_26775 [Deltaproteobacteria bacterium]|nr:hypothetical protein [Deltaproteobacteria bacterium]
MLWMEGLPGNNGHWDLVAHHGKISGGGKDAVGFVSVGGLGEGKYKLHHFGTPLAGGGTSQDCSVQKALDLPLGEWVCVEMDLSETEPFNYAVRINGRNLGVFQLMLDFVSAQCTTNGNLFQDTWYLPAVTVTKFGFRHWHKMEKPVTLWIDDIAIDRKPVGCPTKP